MKISSRTEWRWSFHSISDNNVVPTNQVWLNLNANTQIRRWKLFLHNTSPPPLCLWYSLLMTRQSALPRQPLVTGDELSPYWPPAPEAAVLTNYTLRFECHSANIQVMSKQSSSPLWVSFLCCWLGLISGCPKISVEDEYSTETRELYCNCFTGS